MTTRYLLNLSGAAILGLALLPVASAPANASMASLPHWAIAADQASDVIQVAAKRYGGGGARVNRSATVRTSNVRVNRNVNMNRNVNVNRNVRVNRNVNVYRNVNVNRGLYRSSYVYRGGAWVRPRNYWWPVGGAVAAGAALGVIVASTAVWAGPAPGPGYCWYYTDPSQREGFWDMCP